MQISRLASFHVAFRSQDRRVEILATNVSCHPSERALDPFVSRLILDGKFGAAMLVASDTGSVVVKRVVRDLSAGARHNQRSTFERE